MAAAAIALYKWVRLSRRAQSGTPDVGDVESVDSFVDEKVMAAGKEEVGSV